ncbi:MAG TPA: SAM-dependent chlorinase/fluorinase [Mycobacteriales bacterium]|jgi:S-adenosylmethionine hydrolase|nr:SAM-dependent chlorinase/fluorinase [Mycobacteriales bacterium]
MPRSGNTPSSEPGRYDWLTFTSDYGLDDVFVGVCKGVIAQLAPHVQIIDVTHQITAQDVEQGATSLASAMPYLPVGVHLALVDPLHGGSSRGVVVETGDGSLLVGPDNGLLSLAWLERGGVAAAHELVNAALWRESVHKTFRGRDMFAPVAAHLAAGTPIADVGPSVDADGLTTFPPHEVEVDDDHVHAEVSLVDHFGNVSLNVDRAALEAAGIRFGDTVEVRCNGRTLAVPFTATYGDVARGRLTLCEDSFRAVMLAVNAGHASHELRVGRGEPVVIARLPQTT